jgi:hypothetical protein
VYVCCVRLVILQFGAFSLFIFLAIQSGHLYCEMFRLLSNGFGKVVRIVNSLFVLTSNDIFRQYFQVHCYSND